MRNVFRWLRRTRRATYPHFLVSQPPTPYAPLRPWQVSGVRFRAARFGRRGLDPDEVYAFLTRVAGDLAAAHLDLDRSRRAAGRAGERDARSPDNRSGRRY